MNLVAALEGIRALSFLRFSRFASIRTKMLMFAVVATLLPSLTTVWISYIENKRALQAKASEELLGVSAQAEREVDLWTKQLSYDLRVFSISYEVTENLERIPLVNGEPVRSGIYHKRLTDYLNSVRDRFPDYTELLVLDHHGDLVATSAGRARPVPLPPDWAADLTKNNWALGAPYWDSTGTRAEMAADANRIFNYVVDLGANSVGINFSFYTDGVYPTRVYGVRGSTPNPATLSMVIASARRHGLQVLVRPLLSEKNIMDSRGDWRGSIQPPSVTGWFHSYYEFLKPYFAAAQRGRGRQLQHRLRTRLTSPG